MRIVLMKSKQLWIISQTIVSLFICYLGILVAPIQAAVDVSTNPPAVENLLAGDLIWPKEPGAIIPYSSHDQDVATNQQIWEKERDIFISTLKSNPSLTDNEKRQVEILQNMSYETFLNVYTEDAAIDEVTPFGSAVGVGHVVIVRKLDGNPPTIVEALWDEGVREISYEDWKAEREGQIFWHGRLMDISSEIRIDIAELAAAQVGKPYNFWNFNLENDSGFYCSKLAWLVIRDASKIVVDDISDPVRMLWFSPKQLLKSPYLEILQNPGSYSRS